MKILYILPRYPYPIDKGDKLRGFYQIKLLSKENDVSLVALSSKRTQHDKELLKYCSHVKVIHHSIFKSLLGLFRALFGRIPFQVAFFYSRNVEREISAFVKSINPDLIVFQLIRTAEYVRNIESGTKVIDLIDVLSKGLERRAQLSNIFSRMLLSIEMKKVFRYESEVGYMFDRSLIITDEDKKYLPPNIQKKSFVIENGVDTDFYSPKNNDIRYDLMFSGNMSYTPNIDSSVFLAKKILPGVIDKCNDVKLIIVGANPTQRVLQLKEKSIDVIGWVDDLREYYSRTKIFIAPLRMGTGLQNKILEAMSMGVPCIISSLCAKAFKNISSNEAVICSTADDYINAVINLLNSDENRTEMGENARKYVLKNYNWNSIGDKLNQTLRSIKVQPEQSE